MEHTPASSHPHVLEGTCTCAVMVGAAGQSRTVPDPLCGLSSHRIAARERTR